MDVQVKSKCTQLAFSMLVLAGCVHHENIRDDKIRAMGPVKCGDISVAIVAQTCGSPSEHAVGQSGNAGVHVRLHVVNEGNTAVTIDPRQIRLIDDAGTTAPGGPPSARLLGGGDAMELDLDFVGKRTLPCTQASAVSLKNAIAIGYVDLKFPVLSMATPTPGI
jgi:hypothetical protein